MSDEPETSPSPFTTNFDTAEPAGRQPVVYPLGPNLLQLMGTPMELFDDGFRAVDPATGQPRGDLRGMIQGTWAAASVSAIDQAQITHQQNCRITALERVLEKHRPDIHEEYLAERELVQSELLEQAKEAMQSHPTPHEAPDESTPGD
jgi:hypothetical protein